MLAFLQVLFSYPIIVVTLTILGLLVWRLISFVRKHPSVVRGMCQLLQSPSGIFALLTLIAITAVTWKQPTVGGTAFAAFVAVVPTILSWTEHKEELAKMARSNPASSSPTPDVQSSSLPARGAL